MLWRRRFCSASGSLDCRRWDRCWSLPAPWCAVLDEPVGEFTLCGLTEQEQRRHSHFPQEYYGQPHFMPQAEDGERILSLNSCRCAARAAELLAVDAFVDADGKTRREDYLRAMNRMSSMLYILMIREKAKQSK